MEDELDVLVLAVDGPVGISGAACRLTELDTVLINRAEVSGRRHFDLAHELFHLLTWDAMPPAEIEETGGPKPHTEKLADAFASAVLMPETVIDADWRKAGSVPALAAMINERANALQVSAQALKWRLVSTKRLPRGNADAIPDEVLRHNGGEGPAGDAAPPLFSRAFMTVIGDGVQAGQVSRRRAAKLLDLDPDDESFGDLFRLHGVALPDTVQ
jgi:XRE family transcriptional regulator, fatty acid utilization regulator